MRKQSSDRLMYLVRCEVAVSCLIRWSGWQQRATPAQIAQERRWRAVRRALALDIAQEKQRIGFKGIIPISTMLREGSKEMDYFKAQLKQWESARATDPLKEGVK